MLDIDAEIGYARDAPLHRVRLSISEHEAVLVQGPNGAGKSTLLSTVAGIRRPLKGDVTARGVPTWSSRSKRDIGYVTDPPNLFEELTPSEHLELARSLWNAARVPATGEHVGKILDGIPELAAAMLSLGQRKRVGVALALLHSPALWVLDEPFNGLDEVSASALRDLLHQHLELGGAVICASHDEDALQHADVTIFELGGKAEPGRKEKANGLG